MGSKGGPSTTALQEVPHWKKLIEDPSAGSSGDPPIELLSFVKGVIEKSTPAYIKKDYSKQPFEMFTSKVLKNCFELCTMANLMEEKALELESMRYNDPPPALVKRWEEERIKLSSLLDKKAEDLQSEKEILNKREEKLAEKEREIKEKEEKWTKEKEEWAQKELEWALEKKKWEEEADGKLKRFLQSSALAIVASNLAAPAMKNGLYTLASALGNHYPFKPEELNLQVVPNTRPDLEGYNWDEEKDIMVTTEGEAMGQPIGVFPDLKDLQLKYPWKAED